MTDKTNQEKTRNISGFKNVQNKEDNWFELFHKDLITHAEAEVRENEDASLQDESYSFDEDNTSNDDFHDVEESSFHEEDYEDEDEDEENLS